VPAQEEDEGVEAGVLPPVQLPLEFSTVEPRGDLVPLLGSEGVGRWWAQVVSITRDGETLFPRANTRIEAGDVLMITTHRTNEVAVRAFLEGTRSTPS
jgi:hypothetical protein